MLNREEIIKDVEKNKLIVILRGLNQEQLIHTVEAIHYI
jgi:nitrate reductase NapAB chaperone NapD